MQRDPEARLEIALDHALAVDLENAGGCKSAHQRLAHTSRIGAGLGGEDQRLAHRLDRQGDDDLVCDLGRLSVAIAPDKRDVLAHEREDRLDLLERALRPADHDGEARRLRADLAAGNRSIEIVAAEFIDLFGELLRGDRRDRAHVDDDLAFRQPFGDAPGAKEHGLHVGRVGNHGDDHLGLLADFLPIGASDSALVDQLLRRRATGMNEELMTAFEQMVGHRAPHDAESDETDLCHYILLQLSELRFRLLFGLVR